MQKYMKLVSDQLFSNIFDKWTSHCCTGERQAMILNDFKSSLIPSQLISPGETSEREGETAIISDIEISSLCEDQSRLQ